MNTDFNLWQKPDPCLVAFFRIYQKSQYEVFCCAFFAKIISFMSQEYKDNFAVKSTQCFSGSKFFQLCSQCSARRVEYGRRMCILVTPKHELNTDNDNRKCYHGQGKPIEPQFYMKNCRMPREGEVFPRKEHTSVHV